MNCLGAYRIGETCGIEVMKTSPVRQKCNMCEEIHTKRRQRSAEAMWVDRWRDEEDRLRQMAATAAEVAMVKRSELEKYRLRHEEDTMRRKYYEMVREAEKNGA